MAEMGLDFEEWGTGTTHAARYAIKPCPRCDGRGELGSELLPVKLCPLCHGERVVAM